MLSLGTELLFAFWMASARVGLPAGSPPPVRAATSMFLMSLANSLPRRASTTAFLCLVVAHLEWPLIPASPCPELVPHHVHEQPVQSTITGELGMERGGEHVALPHRDNLTGGTAEHGHVVSRRLDPRRTDEHGAQRVS